MMTVDRTTSCIKRIFVTGGTGFFGKSIFARRAVVPSVRYTVLSRDPGKFRSENPTLASRSDLVWVQGDVRDFKFPEGSFDAIVHAATSAVTTISDAEQDSVIRLGTKRVIAFAKAVECSRILFVSSGAVYGSQTNPVDETAPCRPTTVYGKGKRDAEQMLLDAGLDVKIARCFAFTGIHLNRDIHYAIGNFIRDCRAGRDIVVTGDGTAKRSYLYADDLVDWLFKILDHGETGRPYNVGSDVAVSIRELAEKVRCVLGGMNRIIVKGRPSGKPLSVYVPCVDRARRELGLDVRIPLDEAIRKSV